ncbi:MAG: DedA family protein [Bacteroidales bacterium]|nr:MAG: DedA family protein [Bacteroidales bacterium]
MMDIFQPIIDWYMANMNYLTIFILMAIESSFIPFPSEVVIPPAAWKAAQGDLNFWLVIFFGTLGALIGALFNYYIAKYLGQKLIYAFADTRFAHLCMIDRSKVEKAEQYFAENGKSSTLVGRLIPVIRQLISIPAGLASMPLKIFIIYTVIGAAAWNLILALMGYYLYSQKALLETYYSELSWIMIILGVGFILYLIYKARKKKD